MRPRGPTADSLLLLSYRLPERPSRYRVAVWRSLKRAGAEAVHRALFVLPDTELNRLRAIEIAHDVENGGGQAWMWVGSPLGSALRSEQQRPLAVSRGRPRHRPSSRIGRGA